MADRSFARSRCSLDPSPRARRVTRRTGTRSFSRGVVFDLAAPVSRMGGNKLRPVLDSGFRAWGTFSILTHLAIERPTSLSILAHLSSVTLTEAAPRSHRSRSPCEASRAALDRSIQTKLVSAKTEPKLTS